MSTSDLRRVLTWAEIEMVIRLSPLFDEPSYLHYAALKEIKQKLGFIGAQDA